MRRRSTRANVKRSGNAAMSRAQARVWKDAKKQPAATVRHYATTRK
jgi:hypothetical protein